MLKRVAGEVQAMFLGLRKREPTTIRSEQILLLSDFIANI